jgi:hypothetical protein
MARTASTPLAVPALAALAALALLALAGCDDYLIGENDPPPPDALFAVAYLDRQVVREDNVAWRLDPTIGLIIAVSASGEPADLGQLRVVSVDDDSPRVALTFTVDSPARRLAPGTAAGRLGSGQKWIAPLVPEPWELRDAPSLGLRLDYLDPPPHVFAAVVHATVVLAIGDEQAALPFEIDIRATGEQGGGAIGARRVRSAPVP